MAQQNGHDDRVTGPVIPSSARSRRSLALALVLAIALIPACTLKFAKAGARCAKVGDYAQDGTYILKCNRSKRWERGITVAVGDALVCKAFKINCPPAPPAPPPTPPPATAPPTQPPVTITSTPPTTVPPIVCVPPPPDPTTTTTIPPPVGAPTITSFLATQPCAAAPLTTAFIWDIGDPDGDPLTCRLDFDGDGVDDQTITSCDDEDIRSTTFNTLGTRSTRLTVSDGRYERTAFASTTTSAAAADQYQITVRQSSVFTTSQQALIAAASDRWQRVVKTGLPDVFSPPGDITAATCADDGLPSFSGDIDDLLIDIRIEPIDFPGGILGYAGACWSRASSGLPYFGLIVIDADDIEKMEVDGTLDDVILHEMGHIIGIGIDKWTSKLVALDRQPIEVSTDPRFSGPVAASRWQVLGRAGLPPVEEDFGPGSALGHWDETAFNTELMTPFAEASLVATPLSAVTIGALADLGYGVNLSAADAFTLPLPLLALRDGVKVMPTQPDPTPVIPERRR